MEIILKPKTVVVLIIACLLSTACLNTDALLLDQNASYEPAGGTELLLSKEQAKEGLEVIAIIEANGSISNNRTQVMEALREKSTREIGAHAVYVVTANDQYIRQPIPQI
ncbi:MAG: hypothetical protein U5K69_23095 [Balneolaceae bacterium]|nr:hypothetical protein [Balneolaceae bacterium]